MAFDPTQPFVLLDDAAKGRARLLTRPEAVVRADALEDVEAALAVLLTRGGERAGFISYDAGAAIVAAPSPDAEGRSLPLLWFARFGRVETLEGDAIDALLDAGPAQIGPAAPRLDRAAYDAMLARITDFIAAGDIYQANATFAAEVATRGHPCAIFRRLRAAQRAPYGALIHTGSDWILSLSPELFFALDGRALTTRPMKGTAQRGSTSAADDAAAQALAADPKNRAENLMIVDLLRNDLARVAEPGSVAVPALFAVERYPTLLQMTSTVTATARPGIDAIDVLTALFPCGSVTGAPKLRAMQIVAEVEAGQRGVYTGSIGHIAANGDAAFNVAIRTLVMQRGGKGATLGLGGGIVADSVADSEWAEALAKAAFLTRRGGPPDLIETLRFDPVGGVVYPALHRKRLVASAAFLGLTVDLNQVDAALAAATASLTSPARLRLLVAASGAVAVQASPLPAPPAEPVEVDVVPLPVDARDWRLVHKTTDRAFYDDARRDAGCFEVIFSRPDNRLTEGSFTSLFLRRDDGMLLTPPLTDGLLPGILRAHLIATGAAIEAPLTIADLADGFLIGNAVRGLLRARLRAAPVAP